MRVKEKIIHAEEVHTGRKKLNNIVLTIKDDKIASIRSKGFDYKKFLSHSSMSTSSIIIKALLRARRLR